jgi:hypothetical protein
MQRLVAVVFTTAALLACPPPIDAGDGGDGPITVGPGGLLIMRPGWGLNVPPGAVAADTVIQVNVFDTGIPEVPNRTRISFGYRFSPASLTFSVPVTVYLPWDTTRVPEAVDPSSFDMRRQSGTEANAPLPGAKSNPKTAAIPVDLVEAQSDRLGLFWLTSPSEPTIARLEIDPPSASLNVGETQQFTARVIAPTGEALNASVTWGQAPTRVGTIDPRGLFTAKDPGVISIVARAGSQVATAQVAVRGSTGGPSTWAHSNPFPTGNDLFGGAIAPAALGTVFVGENGTVLARTSSGEFTRLFSTPNVTFTAVGGTTPDNAVAVGRLGTSGCWWSSRARRPPPTRSFRPLKSATWWRCGSTAPTAWGWAAATTWSFTAAAGGPPSTTRPSRSC